MSSSAHHRVIVVTGTIGSGKSTACSILQHLGAVVISADVLARHVVAPESEGLARVVERFGPEILALDGSLDRKKLGTIVFRDSAALADLEAITHPRIRALAEQQFEQALREQAPLVIYDCPLYFEAGLDKLGFRKCVLIAANRERCLERIKARDSLSHQEAEARLDAQLPVEFKRQRADIVIENNGTIEELRQSLVELYHREREC
ncbi:MAG: dephospho-CoA kinase [Bdellovibrionales bacterium]|nr:dephospho-CoA kinase [Bdellovibrionales bacterium]